VDLEPSRWCTRFW